MKNTICTAITCLVAAIALPVAAEVCTPEDAQRKAEQAADYIHRTADGDPEKAEAMHAKLLAFQERDPTRSRHTACEAYQRIIDELKRHESDSL
jgi:hypothetical protein